MNKKVLIWEIIGIVFIIVAGTLVHNLYEYTGYNFIVGLFAPINESMWEHWKLGFLPIIIFGLIEYIFLQDDVNNFVFAKAMSLIAFEIVTFGLVALYEIFVGESEFVVHIASFILGAIAAQFVSYNILTKSEQNKKLDFIGYIVFLAFAVIFIKFTLNPPEFDYFIPRS